MFYKTIYNDADVTVTPAESAVAPYNVYIAKAEQSFTFDNYTGAAGSDEVSGAVPYSKEYNFSATDRAALAGGTITYSVVLDEEGKKRTKSGAEIAAFYYTSTSPERDLYNFFILTSIDECELIFTLHCGIENASLYGIKFMNLLNSIDVVE